MNGNLWEGRMGWGVRRMEEARKEKGRVVMT